MARESSDIRTPKTQAAIEADRKDLLARIVAVGILGGLMLRSGAVPAMLP